jgi:hypothetical protein
MQKLLKQSYVAPRLKSSLQKFYCRHHNLVESYEISIPQMTMDLLLFTRCFFPFITAKTFTRKFLGGVRVTHFLIFLYSFVLSYYVSLRSEFRVVMSAVIST